MRSDFYVYVHYKQTDNKPFYVGKGTQDRVKVYAPTKRNPFWHNVMKKHGVRCEIVANNLAENDALDLEILLIAELRDSGFNLTDMTDGGEGTAGLALTESQKRHLSEKMKGNMPKGHGKWMSRVNKERHADPEYGKTVYPKLRGQKRSAKTRALLSKLATGRKLSPEARKKTFDALIERNANPKFIQKLKGASPTSKEVACSNGMVFRNGQDAAAWLKSNGWPKAAATTISRCATGKATTAYGLKWDYTGKAGKLKVEDY